MLPSFGGGGGSASAAAKGHLWPLPLRNHREHGLKVEGRSRTRFQRNTIAHVPHAAVLLAAQACPVLTDNDIGFCQGPAVHCTEQSTGSFAGNTIHDHRGPGVAPHPAVA